MSVLFALFVLFAIVVGSTVSAVLRLSGYEALSLAAYMLIPVTIFVVGAVMDRRSA